MKILIICTGNSCRSQMAQGWLQSFDKDLQVFSAGTHPAARVNPFAIEVMHEAGIDISRHTTNNVDEYLDDEFDYVITVCDDANETCPLFTGKVKQRLHMGFADPIKAQGSREVVLSIYRRIRDEIQKEFFEFYKTKLKK
jgi:arsenate reductase (thioredoxin)